MSYVVTEASAQLICRSTNDWTEIFKHLDLLSLSVFARRFFVYICCDLFQFLLAQSLYRSHKYQVNIFSSIFWACTPFCECTQPNAWLWFPSPQGYFKAFQIPCGHLILQLFILKFLVSLVFFQIVMHHLRHLWS